MMSDPHGHEHGNDSALGESASCSACPLSPDASIAVPFIGDAGLDRRAFLSRAMMSAAMLALAACAGSDGVTAPFSGSASINIADYPALATVGGVALVTLNGGPLALVRSTQTTIVALSRACPHEGATVNTSTGGFTCPRHGARFGPTGQWLGGQQTSSMRSYATTFDATTGAVTIG
jgi:nitrite reductase/ring-hydroxylating ferredoxin subunit